MSSIQITNFLEQPGFDFISASEMETLPDLFNARVKRSPNKSAYQEYDAAAKIWKSWTWQEMAQAVSKWRDHLAAEKLIPGDRVAICRRNSCHWVIFDQAALSLGLVVVPLYVDDRADNIAYVVEHADAKLLLLGMAEQWDAIKQHPQSLKLVQRVLVDEDVDLAEADNTETQVITVKNWLSADVPVAKTATISADDLATIVYTSGTTGRPKGVMLSHRNITENARAGVNSIGVYAEDRVVSFLPLSHMLERTVGYYLTMMSGAEVVFARSIPELAEDFEQKKPTVIISVPRIFERIYSKVEKNLETASPIKRYLFRKATDIGWLRFNHQQGRAAWSPKLLLWPLFDRLVAAKLRQKLGGRVRFTISGGAPLAPAVSRIFLSFDIPVFQGYGLTESSPVISVNTKRYNRPDSIGPPLRGIEVRIGEKSELQMRGASVMLGYWKNPQATAEVIDEEGWLKTGDQARIDAGYIYITGRLKDIIVLANGEKVAPADMELAIAEDALFEQSLVIGEGKPCLSVLTVLNPVIWEETSQKKPELADLNSQASRQYLLERIGEKIRHFPGYAKIYAISAMLEPWTVENGLLTPTLKIRRPQITARFASEINAMYQEKDRA